MLGWFVEDTRKGPRIVLVQPFTHPDGSQENIEHEANGPEELWNAFVAMGEDPGLAPDIEPTGDGAPRDELMELGMEGAESVISSLAGATAGRLAGAVIRNPARARAAGNAVMTLLGRVSWSDRGQRGTRG